jgi:hypothetical protein
MRFNNEASNSCASSDVIPKSRSGGAVRLEVGFQDKHHAYDGACGPQVRECRTWSRASVTWMPGPSSDSVMRLSRVMSSADS